MNEDIKNVVTNALEEVFEELKDNALDFVENTVFWVKIRAKLINTGINLVWSVTKKVVTKILEKAADDETAPAVQ